MLAGSSQISRSTHSRRELMFLLSLAVWQLLVVVPAQIPGVKYIDSDISQVMLLPSSLARAILAGAVPTPVYCLICVGCAWLVTMIVRRSWLLGVFAVATGWGICGVLVYAVLPQVGDSRLLVSVVLGCVPALAGIGYAVLCRFGSDLGGCAAAVGCMTAVAPGVVGMASHSERWLILVSALLGVSVAFAVYVGWLIRCRTRQVVHVAVWIIVGVALVLPLSVSSLTSEYFIRIVAAAGCWWVVYEGIVNCSWTLPAGVKPAVTRPAALASSTGPSTDPSTDSSTEPSPFSGWSTRTQSGVLSAADLALVRQGQVPAAPAKPAVPARSLVVGAASVSVRVVAIGLLAQAVVFSLFRRIGYAQASGFLHVEGLSGGLPARAASLVPLGEYRNYVSPRRGIIDYGTSAPPLIYPAPWALDIVGWCAIFAVIVSIGIIYRRFVFLFFGTAFFSQVFVTRASHFPSVSQQFVHDTLDPNRVMMTASSLVVCAYAVIVVGGIRVHHRRNSNQQLYLSGSFWQVVGCVVTAFAVTSFSSWSRVGVFDVAYTGLLEQRNSKYALIWGVPVIVLLGLSAATMVVAVACWLAARRSPLLLRIGVLCLAVVGLSVAGLCEWTTTGSLNWVVAGVTVLCCGAGVGMAYALLPAHTYVTADGLPPAVHHPAPQAMK